MRLNMQQKNIIFKMRYISTYEGLFKTILKSTNLEIFRNKYIKKIVSKFDKLLINNFKYEYEWTYDEDNVRLVDEDNVDVFMTIDYEERKSYLYTESSSGKYLKFRIKSKLFDSLEEFIYLHELLIKYGIHVIPDPVCMFKYDQYIINLDHAKELINNLELDKFIEYKDLKKYNL
jgi:hypothetical protein